MFMFQLTSLLRFMTHAASYVYTHTKYIQVYSSTPVYNRCTHPPPKYNVCFRKAQTLESVSPYTAVSCIVSFGITTWLKNQFCCQKKKKKQSQNFEMSSANILNVLGRQLWFFPNCHSFEVLYSSKGNSSWVCSSVKDACILLYKIL